MIVHLSYYNCREFYYILKEPSTTTGRADLAFMPKDSNHIPMIIELKQDGSVESALEQIKNKKYINLFDGYKGKVLLLVITYDSKTLVHQSRIEYVNF